MNLFSLLIFSLLEVSMNKFSSNISLLLFNWMRFCKFVLNKANVGPLVCRNWLSWCFRRSNWGSGQIRSKTSRGFAKRFGHSGGAVGLLLLLACVCFFNFQSTSLCPMQYLVVSVSPNVLFCCVHICIIIKFSSQFRHGWIMDIKHATNCVFRELYA